MYPNLGYLFEDLFNTKLSGPFTLLYALQSFGFMMAMAFLAAAWTLYLEVKRKENEKLLLPVPRKVIIGGPASVADLVINGITGFIIGFKLIAIALDLKDFTDNPQSFILSSRGNLMGGLAVGALLVYLKYREKEKERLPKPEEKIVQVWPRQMIGDITIVAAISGLLGAKVFDNLEHLDAFLKDPIGSMLSFSGLAFYGGLIFGAAGCLYFCYRNKLSMLHMLDAAAPGLILAYGVGRIGCQVAGDGDWGIDNLSAKPGWFIFPDWAWAFNYAHNVNQDGIPIPGCEGKYCYMLANPVFPTPLYEIVASLLIFSFLWMIRKRITIPGMLFSIYLILGGIERFFIEKIRVDIKYHIAGFTATQAQIIAIFMIVIGIAGIIFFRRKTSRSLPVS
ncbi:MAG: prolipoprotein diacylglyceryl transferase [Chitinophagaceae bacterium]|nr:prolipoprotein diacylglyceryl transferase [Chitinophagaceae bacterium]